MSETTHFHSDEETDALLRDVFAEADEPRLAHNLADRAMRLALSRASAADANALFVRRCVRVMNVLGIALIAAILYKGAPTLWAVLQSDDSTTTTTTTSTSTLSLTAGLEITLAALLLFVAAGTQWAFRAPPHAGLLPIGSR